MTFDTRVAKLIALGASIGANCQSCLEYHGRKAAEYGIDPGEVAQAIEIGRAVRQGAASNVDRVADGLRPTGTSAASAADAGARPSDGPCCGSAAKAAAGGDERGESTCFPNRCAPFSSMMDAWRSGGFPFPGPPAAKS